MDNPRDEKVAVVTEVRERFEHANAAILTEYRGLTVKDLAALRRTLRDAGSEYKIYKNTLVRFAARDVGLDQLESLLVGPTAIAFVDGDAAAVAKALRDYARTNPKLTVKGGVLGKRIISVADATALADLPPRDVVLARVAGALAAPLQTFAGLLQALPRSFAYGLKALIDKRGGPEAAEAPTAASSEGADAADTPASEGAGGVEAPASGGPPSAEAPAEGARAAEAPASPGPPSEAPAEAASSNGAGGAEAPASPVPPSAEASAPAASEGTEAAPAAPVPASSEAADATGGDAAGSASPEAAPSQSEGQATETTEPAESAVSATTSEPPPEATATSEPAESAVSPAPAEASTLADHNVSDPGVTLAASEAEPRAAEGSPEAYDETEHPPPAPATEAGGDTPPDK